MIENDRDDFAYYLAFVQLARRWLVGWFGPSIVLGTEDGEVTNDDNASFHGSIVTASSLFKNLSTYLAKLQVLFHFYTQRCIL